MKSNFGANLEKILTEKGWSRYRLAKELGCHAPSVSNWIDDGMKPQKAMLEKIGIVLGYVPETLFTDHPEKISDNVSVQLFNTVDKYFKQKAEFQKKLEINAKLKKIEELQREIDELDKQQDLFIEKFVSRVVEALKHYE